MPSPNELSTNISTLFSLKKDQFQREVHLSFAKSLVSSFHRDCPSLASLADLLTFKTEYFEVDAPKQGVGLYTL